ncbi:DUF3299 domain-containing protein [Ascidiaceihabitans sp.]|jgi:hypothetical protein|nr:DUF3299 domain-containing protein [Ascidiaceihabitans sp.]MBT3467020.1 DUF3299 domain-containing protein [Paracoccaceae bacterium]MDC1319988.1 DUF3299 domain-containing protein [bacterium]HCI06478.1 DUF3299 domain-containing protein [Sulfitobacter sp.]MDA9135631.1 DUF3299 domain-containing protein [Ascidiaceihabitans sp.]MDC1275419.1 DUF3299 domain-containing protein [Ascidiaceihabitans sp.]
MQVSRRKLITSALASAALPRAALAKTPTEITWDDLIPPGVPYSEIVAAGEMDETNDIWQPVFDENATKLNPVLDGAYIKMPGYIIPIDQSTDGVTSFVLVPYVGACLHTPPPPANQLVFVTTNKPWPSDNLWDAVWVTGQMQHELQSTEVAETGYLLKAEEMETYVW